MSLPEDRSNNARPVLQDGGEKHWVFAQPASQGTENKLPSTNPQLHNARLQQALALNRFLGVCKGCCMFASMEPRLNIILDLYINEQKGRALTVGDACIAAGVPPTTALRTIDALEKEGLVARYPDRTDSRRRRLMLRPGGQQMLETLLDQLISSSTIDLRCN